VEIKVGDLVMVVRKGCIDANLGKIFTVTNIEPYSFVCCADCGREAHGTGRRIFHKIGIAGFKGRFFYESRLRLINPLSEVQETENYEVMTK
jgi:hypothetical protein